MIFYIIFFHTTLAARARENELYCKFITPKIIAALADKYIMTMDKSYSLVEQRIGQLTSTVPPAMVDTPLHPGFNVHQPELYYRYLTFSTLAYYSYRDVIDFSSLVGNRFYTGISIRFHNMKQAAFIWSVEASPRQPDTGTIKTPYTSSPDTTQEEK